MRVRSLGEAGLESSGEGGVKERRVERWGCCGW